MDDDFTTERLRARSGTRRMVKLHLSKPDATSAAPRGRSRKPIRLYDRDRVLLIEGTAARMSSTARTVASHSPWVFTASVSEPGRLDMKLNWRKRCSPSEIFDER